MTDTVHETNNSKSDISSSKSFTLQILQRIADNEILIADLKQAIRNPDAAMKKAQTRLENRLLRPRQESCRDDSQYGYVLYITDAFCNTACVIAITDFQQQYLDCRNSYIDLYVASDWWMR